MAGSLRQRVFKRFAPFAGVLAFAFAVGVGAELSNVHIVAFLSIIGILALALTAALLPTGSGRPPPRTVLEGLVLGALASILIILGAFLPYAARWGGREPDSFGGGDASCTPYLPEILMWAGLFGAAIGAVCGLLAWALRRVQRRRIRGH